MSIEIRFVTQPSTAGAMRLSSCDGMVAVRRRAHAERER